MLETRLRQWVSFGLTLPTTHHWLFNDHHKLISKQSIPCSLIRHLHLSTASLWTMQPPTSSWLYSLRTPVLNRGLPDATRDDNPTDAQVALELYREELRENALTISDHRLGEKLGRTDGTATGPPSPIESPTPIFDAVLGRPSGDQELGQCTACEEARASELLITTPCGDSYCARCVRELFDLAMNDESLFPPRCCRQPITLSLVKEFLDEDQIQLFEDKTIEYATTGRTYCHDTCCGKFIPPSNIDGEKATCKRCGLQTCAGCKSAAHEGDCPYDANYALLMETAEAAGYRVCYQCKRLVELNFGCNHITYVGKNATHKVCADLSRCLCRAEFCYLCGVSWKECACPWWDEARLYARREQIAAREGGAPNAVRVQQIEEDLRERHECEHRYFKRVNVEARCELCRANMHGYLLECRQCHLRTCVRCKRNRL